MAPEDKKPQDPQSQKLALDDWAAAVDEWDLGFESAGGDVNPSLPAAPPSLPPAPSAPSLPADDPMLGLLDDATVFTAPPPPAMGEPEPAEAEADAEATAALDDPLLDEVLDGATRVAGQDERRLLAELDARVGAADDPIAENFDAPLDDDAPEIEVVIDRVATAMPSSPPEAQAERPRADPEALDRLRQALDELPEPAAAAAHQLDDSFYDEIAIEVVGGGGAAPDSSIVVAAPPTPESKPAATPAAGAVADESDFELLDEQPVIARPLGASDMGIAVPAPEDVTAFDEFEVLGEDVLAPLHPPLVDPGPPGRPGQPGQSGQLGRSITPTMTPPPAHADATPGAALAPPEESPAPDDGAAASTPLPPAISLVAAPDSDEPDGFDLLAQSTANLAPVPPPDGAPVGEPARVAVPLPEVPLPPPIRAAADLAPVADLAQISDEEPTQERDALRSLPRLTSEFAPLRLQLPELGPALPVDALEARRLIELCDGERATAPSERAPRLALWAGGAALRAVDLDAARERFQSARDAEPKSRIALRGLRRVALAWGRTEDALGLLEGELAAATAEELPGLQVMRAELLLATGDRAAAQALFADLATRDDGRLGRLGQIDADGAAAAEDGAGAAAIARLGDLATRVGDPGLRAAIQLDLGRLAELRGADGEATGLHREVVTRDGTRLGGALGLLRAALRAGDKAGELAAIDLLAEASSGRLRAAFERRAATIALSAGDAEAAARRMANADDVASLDLRARANAALGRLDEAATTRERLVDRVTDPAARQEPLLALAATHELRGDWPAVARAIERALDVAPGDLGLGHWLERVERERSDPERQLAAARGSVGGVLGALRASRILVGQGRSEEAARELDAALEATTTAPSLVLAEERVALAGDAGRLVDAAEVLARVAAALREEDPTLAAAVGARAARLFARAGDSDRALTEAAGLRDELDGPLVSRFILALLRRPAGRDATLAAALGAEISILGEELAPAGLFFERGLAQSAAGEGDPLASYRRTLAMAPDHEGALLACTLEAAGAGRWSEVAERLAARVAASRGARLAAALRQAGIAGDQLADLDACHREYTRALEALAEPPAPAAASGRGLVELAAAAARGAGDWVRAVDLAARGATAESTPGERFVGAVKLADACARELQETQRAVAHYQAALEARPDAALISADYERALLADGRHVEVVERAQAELRDSSEVARRVAAYEKLARIDEEQRGDTASALLSRYAILEIDHANHASYRAIERDLIASGRSADLVHLYDQLGLAAADARLAAAVILERARLREAVGGSPADVASDLRQALFKDGTCQPALQRLLTVSRAEGDLPRTIELCERMVGLCASDSTAAAIFAARAGDALVELGRTEEALRLYRDALTRQPLHLMAARALGRTALAAGDFAAAVDAAEAGGRAARDPAERARAWLVAALLAEQQLVDRPRAIAALREVLAAHPAHREAFDRLQRLLAGGDDAAALVEALLRRSGVESDDERRVTLRLELATLYRDRIGDRDQAREQLRRVLEIRPQHGVALELLSQLYYDDAHWAHAAETLIRRARVETTPTVLRDVFFRLGTIYADHLPDTRRALVSFTRVLQVEPANRVALEYLSTLYEREADWKGALAATQRLVELTDDPGTRIGLLHRVARIQEQGFKNLRAAHEALRQALDLDLGHLASIGELAHFYERSGDPAALRVHLDRSAQTMRARANASDDEAALHALFRILSWRHSIDHAWLIADLLQARGQADEEERALLTRFARRDTAAGPSLVGAVGGSGDLPLDEALFHREMTPGLRSLFRSLDEPLQKGLRSDLKRLGVAKSDRLPRSGHAIRDVANRLASDFGVRDFDLYVSAAVTTLSVELTDPLSIVIGERLIAGANVEEIRFHLGGVLRLVRSGMAVPLHTTPEEFGLLVGGLVRQFVPDFVPSGYAAPMLANEAARLAKFVPRRLHQELMTFALECADPALDLRAMRRALDFTAVRAGLLASGSVLHAHAALRRRGDPELLAELLRLVTGDDLAELRRTLGVALA